MTAIIDEGDAPSSLARNNGRRPLVVVLFVFGIVFGSIVWETCNTRAQGPHKNSSQGEDTIGTLRASAQASCHWCLRPQHDQHVPWSFGLQDAAGEAYTHRAFHYQNRSNMVVEFNSTVQFIFTIGLEGTGHHLMGSITKESPAVKLLNQSGIWDTLVGPLQHVLFSDYSTWRKERDVGIWNAHCAPHKKAAELELGVVEKLKGIEAQVKKRAMKYIRTVHNFTSDQVTWPLPLNTAKALNGGRFGEVSYPNYKGNCRPLNYPDLNLLYNACRKAKVDCFQVYVYRHPFDILKSVSRRGFAKRNTESMQLYMEHLHVIANQLRMYASKTLGCFGFFSDDENDNYWVEAQKDLWAWDDADEYNKAMQEIYKDPSHDNITSEEKVRSWLSSNSRQTPYIMSLWKMHQHAVQSCRHAVKERMYR